MGLPLTVPHRGIETMAIADGLAVVIVDMQKTYVGYTTKQKRERLVQAHRQILEVCAKQNVPVAVLEMDCDGGTIPDLGEMLRQLPRLEFMTKSRADGFWRTFLAHHLYHWKSRELLITGCLASACVRATTEAALFRDFKVRTAETLIADADIHGIEPHSERWYRTNGCLRESSLDALFSN